MNKLHLIILLLFLPFCIYAQTKFTKDSLHIVEKYRNDTLNFSPFMREASLIDSITPDKKYVSWELNSAGWGNIYRFPRPETPLPNSEVLSQLKEDRGFYKVCAPMICRYYLSAQQKNGKVTTIDDYKSLKKFLSKLDNPYNAYLWLYFHDDISTGAMYKPVEKGFLIRVANANHNDMVFPRVVREGFSRSTYFVGNDGKIAKVNSIYHPTIYAKRPTPIGTMDVKVISIEVPYDSTSVEVTDSTRFADKHLPIFPGGIKEFVRCIYDNVRYPEEALENGIEGRIIAEISLDENGNTTDVKLVRALEPILDKETVNTLKRSRCGQIKWISAERDGKKVPAVIMVEIRFRLLD